MGGRGFTLGGTRMTEEAANTQTSILQEAIAVLGNRSIDHGEFMRTYSHTAALWSAYLAKPGYHPNIGATDVLIMMALMKMARAKHGNAEQREHYVDVCGYAALAGAVFCK